jgi:hypothetical protein
VDISIKTNELEPNRDQTDLIAELHQLRTQLERAMVKAERYDKLRAWMLSPSSDKNFFENMTDGEEPATGKVRQGRGRAAGA